MIFAEHRRGSGSGPSTGFWAARPARSDGTWRAGGCRMAAIARRLRRACMTNAAHAVDAPAGWSRAACCIASCMPLSFIGAAIRHVTRKHLNNRIESNHAALKRLLLPMRGFRDLSSAKATLDAIAVRYRRNPQSQPSARTERRSSTARPEALRRTSHSSLISSKTPPEIADAESRQPR